MRTAKACQKNARAFGCKESELKLSKNGSVVVRPSGTEPKMKVYVSISAADEQAATAKESNIVSFMEQILK